MHVAITGVGSVHPALSKAASTAGHTVSVSASSPEKAAVVAAETGARPAATT